MKSYTNLKKGEGLPLTAFQRFIFYFPFVLSAVFVVFAIVTLVRWFSEDDLGSMKSETYPYGTALELSNLAKFRLAYLSANGGMEMLDALRSVRVSGYMERDGVSHRFFSVKKRPNQMLLTFEFEDSSLTYGVDGQQVWRRLVMAEGEPEVVIVDGDLAQEMIHTAQFFGPIMRIMLMADGGIERLEATSFGEQECLKVFLKESDYGEATAVYVDPETMTPIARTETFADGRVRKTLYGNYHQLSGMQEPFLIETYMDDVLQNRVVVESGDSNFGVMSSVFKAPDI